MSRKTRRRTGIESSRKPVLVMMPNAKPWNFKIGSTKRVTLLADHSWFVNRLRNLDCSTTQTPPFRGVLLFLGVGGSRRTNTKTAELSSAVVRSTIDDGVPEMATVSACVVLAVIHVLPEEKISAGVQPFGRSDTTPESCPSVAFSALRTTPPHPGHLGEQEEQR